MSRRKRLDEDMDAEDEDEDDPRELSDRAPLTRKAGRRASTSAPHLQVPQQPSRMSSRSLQPQRAAEEPRRSIILPSLEQSEREFFNLIDAGDVGAVQQFLRSHSGFNINCKNFQGTTALHKAVESGSVELTEALLSQGANVGDCLLHAVRSNRPRILDVLLKHIDNPDLEQAGCLDSPNFPENMTPLMLAAQCGHYELVEMLLERGHRLEPPHPPDCYCEEVCQRDLEEDSLVRATNRLNQYRAVINPAYICLSSEDPILMAFQLCIELRQWAKVVEEFRIEYTSLSKEVRRFAVELLACCRSSEEVQLILRRREGCNIPGTVDFPRLVLAMDLVQKEFVAHPNTQTVLAWEWTGDWVEWRTRSLPMRALDVVTRIPMLPIIAGWCVVAPQSRMVRQWSLPINRLISSVAAYVVFLTLLFLESNTDKKLLHRGPPDTGLEPVLMVFVGAHVWSDVRMCLVQGPRRYFKVLTNWYDVVTHLLFVATFTSWLCALLDVQASDQETLERAYWHYLDPTLVAEGLFAIGTIMAFGRLLLLFQLNYHLGPLLVSVGKMTRDIAKYTAIFALFFLAFTAGLCRFYQYYEGMVRVDPVSKTTTAQISSFVNPTATLKTLFWALFTMSPLESADVVIQNLPDTDVINRHYFTETIGYIAFALFEVISVIVMLNMLIATMSNTFQKVTDNVAIEWTFGKTEVYLRYMSQTVLPPPFNLLPTLRGMQLAGRWMRALCSPRPGEKAGCSMTNCCYLISE
ncbi:short transient receptor potential channel 4-like [Schistocerca serialis cubense]|uniref:short transient receptor potential channel 4-like n=1 Tax=Schistocerca serialis cubense TaxID=2023355 RepID=UPI00214F4327|nr:short transient receptor potential channel 4-like [Schistocerca serialis cubense]